MATLSRATVHSPSPLKRSRHHFRARSEQSSGCILLELVEPNIPAAITFVLLFVRRTEMIRQLRDVNPESEQRYQRLLGKLAKLASDGLEKALESGLEIVEIDNTIPNATAFELLTDYSVVTDLEAFQKEFFVPQTAPDWD